MASHEVLCAVLAYLISKHRYGSPVPKQQVIRRSGVRSDQRGEVKEAFEELRSDAPFVTDCGDRGIELDTSEFGLLADYLYIRCEWNGDRIRSRLKHYEGWSDHEWTAPDR